ncbi:MAG: family 78 glycoside hydrolase catalytic domain [Phycisphaerae bacterium]|nr:family 78 glycoside hydrolase catalytic domain [Phycisphaerae bacterium]
MMTDILPGEPQPLVVSEMYCEYAVNPLGLDIARPRFSWVLASRRRNRRQSAYRICVSTSRENLRRDHGDKFDSGKVFSAQSVNVPYDGLMLSSGERCYWKVRCWDADGVAGPWSEPATFEMGLVQPGDWRGVWIGADPDVSAPLLRTEFSVPGNIRRARVYISGLGCYELYLNGGRVGDHVLDPASTDYDKRILYATYDVTEYLREGTNAIGVMLGAGFYCQPSEPDLTDVVHAYGDSPRLLMQMNIQSVDGDVLRVKTDETWRVSPGPILFNSVVGGEVYDARREQPGWAAAGFDDSRWSPAVVKESPGGVMESQLLPAIKVNRTLTPVSLAQPSPGKFVYDLGQCFGGWARLHVKGPRGTKITIQYGEYLEPGGLIDKRPYPGSQETNTYILKGEGEEIHEPRFTYHPVRYVQVEGHPGEPRLGDLEGRVVYSDVDLFGTFECSNPLLNRIHQNVEWTLTNQSFGLPLDCLHREKCAPLDPASVGGALYTRKHMPRFWTKWLRDIRLARKDGVLPDAAPSYRNLYPGGPHVCYLPLVWYVYQCYGDRRVLEEHYDGMKAWTDYLTSQAEDHLLVLGGLELCSDHMLPGKSPGEEEFMSSETPGAIIFTGCYYRNALLLGRIAEVLGRTRDAQNYANLAKKIADAFNREWFNEEKRRYVPESQTADLFPLALGIVPKGFEEDVIHHVVESIVREHDGHLHTGTIGTTAMVETLATNGLADVMFRAATVTSYPGWGYMVDQGATTIWESWGRFQPKNPRWRADSMMMWATIDRFLYNDLAGIAGPGFFGPDGVTPGFERFDIRPRIPEELHHAGASIRTVRGVISSRWRKDFSNRHSLILDVTVPVNSTASIHLPKLGGENCTVEESGTVIWKDHAFLDIAPGILAGREEPRTVVIEVGSGTYRFVISEDTHENPGDEA